MRRLEEAMIHEMCEVFETELAGLEGTSGNPLAALDKNRPRAKFELEKCAEYYDGAIRALAPLAPGPAVNFLCAGGRYCGEVDSYYAASVAAPSEVVAFHHVIERLDAADVARLAASYKAELDAKFHAKSAFPRSETRFTTTAYEEQRWIDRWHELCSFIAEVVANGSGVLLWVT